MSAKGHSRTQAPQQSEPYSIISSAPSGRKVADDPSSLQEIGQSNGLGAGWHRDEVTILTDLIRRRRLAWGELATEKWVLPRPGTTVRTALDRILRLNAPGKLPMIVE